MDHPAKLVHIYPQGISNDHYAPLAPKVSFPCSHTLLNYELIASSKQKCFEYKCIIE